MLNLGNFSWRWSVCPREENGARGCMYGPKCHSWALTFLRPRPKNWRNIQRTIDFHFCETRGCTLSPGFNQSQKRLTGLWGWCWVQQLKTKILLRLEEQDVHSWWMDCAPICLKRNWGWTWSWSRVCAWGVGWDSSCVGVRYEFGESCPNFWTFVLIVTIF